MLNYCIRTYYKHRPSIIRQSKTMNFEDRLSSYTVAQYLYVLKQHDLTRSVNRCRIFQKACVLPELQLFLNTGQKLQFSAYECMQQVTSICVPIKFSVARNNLVRRKKKTCYLMFFKVWPYTYAYLDIECTRTADTIICVRICAHMF